MDWDEQDELLAELRTLGDPVADEPVRRLDEQMHSARELGKGVVDRLRHTEDPDTWLDRHFAVRPTLPDWIDWGLVREGQALYRRQPWSLNIAFLLSSLPTSYCAAAGAELLCRTGFLSGDTQRRVFETSLLVMEIADEGGLNDGRDGPPGAAYLTLLRIRLLHAAARRAVLEYPSEDGPWDRATNGMPVSQLDLLGTTWAFALSSMTALEQARLTEPDQDLRGWVHLWCVVGHLLGVTETSTAGPLFPMEPVEAAECFAAVQRVEFRTSPAGVALTKALVAVAHRRIPRESKDHLVEAMIRANIGDELADLLELPVHTDRALLEEAGALWRRAMSMPMRRWLPPIDRWRAHRMLLHGVAGHLAEAKHDPFRPPADANRLLRRYHDMAVREMVWHRRLRNSAAALRGRLRGRVSRARDRRAHPGPGSATGRRRR